MRAAIFSFALLLVAGCAGSPPEAATTMVGTWKGEGGQWDDGDRSRVPDRRWPLDITVARTLTGELRGGIDYPSFECGGLLRYIGPSSEPDAQPGDVIFREEITYGGDICFTGGTVLLRLDGASLVYAWATDASAAVAAARLRRVD